MGSKLSIRSSNIRGKMVYHFLKQKIPFSKKTYVDGPNPPPTTNKHIFSTLQQIGLKVCFFGFCGFFPHPEPPIHIF